MKKTLFIIAVAFIAVMPVRAQFNSHVMQCSTEFVKNVIVRNYTPGQEYIFTYYEDPSVYYMNPPFSGLYQTNISLRINSIDNNIMHIVSLPNGYRVYDAGFVSLNHSGNRVYDFLVFCGTRYTYYGKGDYRYLDSNGFVGYYYVGQGSRSALDSVHLNNIYGTRQLKKLVSYAQTNVDQSTNCGINYLQSGVIDMIGEPNTSVYPQTSTCLVRARFCPECANSSYHWETSVYNSAGSTEKFVDITATISKVVTASVYEGDTQMLWLRHFAKEQYCQSTTLTTPISSEQYSVDLSTINSEGFYLPSPMTTHFKMPVRLSPLQNDEFVLSFVAYNGAIPTRKGLYSYRINLSPSPHVVHGVLDTAVVSLIDVSHFPDTLATVWLAKNVRNQYIIPTVRWRIIPQMMLPNQMVIHKLTNKKFFIQSIDAYKYSNNQYIHMGGYFTYTLKRRLLLSEQTYCDNGLNNACFLYNEIHSNVFSIAYSYNFPSTLTAKIADTAPARVMKNDSTITISVFCQ
ncbi:MAG: hypothetical protein IJU81_01510 [Bacteroidales bacterium]|nr:hypothetical protein [Bacteroidales bacterium]